MKNARTPRPRPSWIRGLRQLRAVVSPIRQEITDAVIAIGPCSIGEIAAFLGRKPSALYSHVERLLAAGVLLEAGVVQHAGRPAMLVDVPGRPYQVHYDISDARQRALLRQYVAAMVRNAARSIDRAMASGAPRAHGDDRELWAARLKGWLTEDELRRVNGLLNELINVFRSGARPEHPDAKLYEVTFLLNPMALGSTDHERGTPAPR